MTLQLSREERPTIIYDESGFPVGETVAYAAIRVFDSESGEFLARMKSLNLEHIGSLVSSFVSCAQATGCSIKVHLEINVGAPHLRARYALWRSIAESF